MAQNSFLLAIPAMTEEKHMPRLILRVTLKNWRKGDRWVLPPAVMREFGKYMGENPQMGA